MRNNNYMDDANKVEILAPAGSYDIMKAVIQAGADAVYLGGDFFGARAFAGNFHQDELITAIGYAHQFDRKIYLTVNTLLKETEIENQLISYLLPFYEAGLDAVIVQDFGVFHLVRKHFPDLHIHASTQMTQTGLEGAKLLYQAGAARVVTSRELNCSEIRAIHDGCDVEIESFVHGALCYCYSGQCLLSSFNGGRSGNRGRCAQPCRLPYQVKGAGTEEKYILSPKDMCALPLLPDVIEAGVYSLKIEGRMKNVSYAAGVTAIYRKYVDLYLKKGRSGYQVDLQDINDLMDLYNRGAFTGGYYTCDKGREMLSLNRPNHMGTRALKVLENVSGQITFEALEPIHAQDVFEIDREHSFSSGSSLEQGKSFVVNLPKKYLLKPGMTVYRTRNQALTDWVKNAFVKEHLRINVDIAFTAITGCLMSLTFYTQEQSVTVEGQVIGKAKSQPAVEEEIREQLCRLGDTVLEAGHVEVVLSEDAFIPASCLKKIKREAAVQFLGQLRKKKQRNFCNVIQKNSEQETLKEKAFKDWNAPIHVLLENLSNFDMMLEYKDITEIYFEYQMLYDQRDALVDAVKRLHASGRRGILALPHIVKQKNAQKLIELIEIAEETGIDGYLVRNLETMGLLNIGSRKSIYTDAGLYITNSYSKIQLQEFAKEAGQNIERMTLPYELTATELEYVSDDASELIAYGRIPMMLSEQCVAKTLGKCSHKNGVLMIENQSNQYCVKSCCSFCYTVTQGIRPLDLTGEKEVYENLRPGSIRLEFSTESRDDIIQILSSFNHVSDKTEGLKKKHTTLGHFYRGVD